MAVDTHHADTSTETSSKGSLLYDPKFRAIVSQSLLILLILWLGYEIVQNTRINLEKQNIASGFRFLNSTAGFGVNQSLIEYSEESSYGRVFLVGLLNTILVAFMGIVLATALGFVVGVARLSHNWLISKLAAIYVEIVRNIPLLLQIFFWYFAVLRTLPNPRNSVGLGANMFVNNRGLYMPKPLFESAAILIPIAFAVALVAVFFIKGWARKRQQETGEQFPVFWTSVGLLLGLPIVAYFIGGMPVSFDLPALKGFNFKGGMSVIPEFIALLLALSTYTASYIGEIVRAGILSVSHGQTEASHALGLRRGPTLRLVVIPQALRVIIPPLTNQYLNLTKNSSLAVAIAYPDLVSVFAGTTLNQTGQAVEIILMTMLVYLTLSLLTSAFMNWYNARIALVER